MRRVRTIEDITESLLNLPDANLLGCQLLIQEQVQQGVFFPKIENERLINATMQYLKYLDATYKTTSKLRELPPIPLDQPVEEFSL